MKIEELKELLKAFDGSSVQSLKLEDENGKLELEKQPAGTVVIQPEVRVAAEKPCTCEGTFVNSPIVGIAYKSSKPGADPYVKIGDKVQKGQTLCIVEAMKMFNEIKSTCDGEITNILFEDGQLVEYDMPLFEIKE